MNSKGRPAPHARDGWADIPDEALTTALDAALPRFLERQRWFAAKGRTPLRLALARRTHWRQWLWLRLEVTLPDATTQTYSLPLALAPAEDPAPPAAEDLIATLTPADGRPGVVVYDAFADARFCRALLAALRDGERIAEGDSDGGTLEFAATRAFFERLAGDELDSLPVRRAGTSSSNTALLIGERLFLKAYRRLAAGINPEVEMGRFLTEVSPYAHIAPLAGSLEYRAADGTPWALVMLQGQVASHGDAWTHTLAALCAYLAAGRDADAARREADHRRWSTLGRRTGELHRALARVTGDADFDPQPISAADVAGWSRQIADEATQTLDALDRQLAQLPTALHGAAQRLLGARAAAQASIAACAALPPAALRTRYHGDFHLGQVLIAGDECEDFVIIDFEGEPSRPLAERRRRHSPLRDVAGMLRSFNYAASSALASTLAAPPADADAGYAARLAALAADWEARAVAAFLAGYRAASGTDAAADAALLDLFLLEKAFYELRYELNHRPDWVHVPLGGLLGLLGKRVEENG